MSTKSRMKQVIKRAAELDMQIKALDNELGPLKDEIKLDVGDQFDTYIGEDGFTAKVEAYRNFDIKRARVEFSGVPEAAEAVVTPASVKAYLMAKHPKKWEAKLAEFYNTGSKIAFGKLS